MCQDGTGRKKRFKNRVPRVIYGAKSAINFEAGSINQMSPGIQEVSAMPVSPVGGLVNRQIKNRFTDMLAVSMQPAAEESAAP